MTPGQPRYQHLIETHLDFDATLLTENVNTPRHKQMLAAAEVYVKN